MSTAAIQLSAERATRRWHNEDRRIAAIVADLLSGSDWTVHLLESHSKGWPQLEGLYSCPKSRLPSDAAPRDLRGFTFQDLHINGVQGLADSCLDYAIFSGVSLRDVSFNGSSLRFAKMSGNCLLFNVSFRFSDLTGASLREVAMRDVDITNSDLRGTDFRESEISDCRFRHVSFSMEGILGMIGIGLKPTRFGGVTQSSNRLTLDSSRGIQIYMAEQSKRYDFEHDHPAFARVSYWLTNHGESPGRLFIWVALIWGFFGVLYARFPLPEPLEGTRLGSLLVELAPLIVESSSHEQLESSASAFYLSAVILTTLGLGDYIPNSQCLPALVAVSVEAFLGYLLLGAFVTLLMKNIIPRE